MTSTTSDATDHHSRGTLAALRALATDPTHSIADALHAADRQAKAMRSMLPTSICQIPSHITHLIPSILIKITDDIPVPGISFWGHGHWHIHVRSSDTTENQSFALLRELKHIIDHPLRHMPTTLTGADWDAIASHFAHQVLDPESALVAN